MLKELARLIGVELPIVAERHLKVSFPTRSAAVPRSAPMLIWLDDQHLPWSDDERAALAESEETHGCSANFPGCPRAPRGRPEPTR